MMDPASFVLRPWGYGDIEALAIVANDILIWENLRDRFPHPYTRRDAEQWVVLCEQQGQPAVNFAIEVDGAIAGGIGINILDDVHRHTAELGYWLGPRYWGQGLATAAVIAMTDHAFESFPLERLQAQVFEWNGASARVLTKAGYQLEGRLRHHVHKNGRLGDALMFGRLRDDPVPLEALGEPEDDPSASY
jgi:ribosomal-protein-alanine N-acetyltransferase